MVRQIDNIIQKMSSSDRGNIKCFVQARNLLYINFSKEFNNIINVLSQHLATQNIKGFLILTSFLHKH
jgi:hypothetical protein